MLTPLPTRRWKRQSAEPSLSMIPAPAIAVASQAAPTEEFSPSEVASIREVADGLRNVTVRAHRAIRGGRDDAQSVAALRSDIKRLEADIDRLGLRGLRPFVQSLGRRVDTTLGAAAVAKA